MVRAVISLMVAFVAIGLLGSEAWAGKKKVDTASSNLMRAAATGKHFDTATITMRKAGGDPQLSGKAAIGTARKAR
jgi:hypothetical protein